MIKRTTAKKTTMPSTDGIIQIQKKKLKKKTQKKKKTLGYLRIAWMA